MIKGGPGEQLRLFVDPREHMSTIQHSVDKGNEETMQQMWERKRTQAYDRGLVGDVRQRGVVNPVKLYSDPMNYGGAWVQGNGHHRVAAAAEVQLVTNKQQFVPVEYNSGDFFDDPDNFRVPRPQRDFGDS